jgi:succinoglycan biosynthesis protein ExoU
MEQRRAQISIDVIVAAWNRADTIERALLSALRQPEVHQVIVVDDCSTDNTTLFAQRIAASYNGRVLVRQLSTNGGPAAARNIALELSTAPWVAVLDGDDFFLPGRIKTLLSYADACDFVADNLVQVQQGQGDTPESPLLEENSVLWQLDLEAFALGNVSKRGRLRKELGFLKPLMRRSFLDRHQLRYDETLRLGEDYALYAKALALGARFVVIPARGYVSVERSDSLSGLHTLHDLERLRDVDRDFAKWKAITAPERRALRRHYESVDARAQWIAVTDALKARSARRFIGPFFRSSTVSVFLIRNLVEQIFLRAGQCLYDLILRARSSLKRALPEGRNKV